MNTNELLVTLLLVLPMVGFLSSALIGRRLRTRSWIIAVPILVATWLLAMYIVYETLIVGAFGEEGLHFTIYTWIPAGAFHILFNLAVDNLTAVVLIVVTTVGMLVHIYSVGYMAHDASRWRFFAYLNLFMFSMLLLVLADKGEVPEQADPTELLLYLHALRTPSRAHGGCRCTAFSMHDVHDFAFSAAQRWAFRYPAHAKKTALC